MFPPRHLEEEQAMRVMFTLIASGLCLGAAGTAAASTLLSRDRAYATCLVSNMQRIGATTNEHHSDVLAKARKMCVGYERSLDLMTGSTRNFADPAGNWFGTSKDELVERSERVAVEALFKARARIAKTQ
jgi:hypothetical protein